MLKKLFIKKTTYLYLITSLVITAFLYTYILQKETPLTFSLDNKIVNDNGKTFYNDLDGDGFSEELLLVAHIEFNRFNYGLNVRAKNGLTLDQFNIKGKTKTSFIHFEDCNKDGYKEAFIFSQKDDSLYLSLIDILASNYILENQFIISKPDSATKDYWDIFVTSVGLLNVDDDVEEELIFFITTGYSLYPRNVYSYDLEEKKILNTFVTSANLQTAYLGDVSGNGTNEIIIRSCASGNMEEPIGYHDHTNWLFVLDSNLTPIFTPQKFGEYKHGGLEIAGNNPLFNNGILVANLIIYEDSTFVQFMLIDKEGKIQSSNKFKEYLLNGLFIVNNGKSSNALWLSSNGNINLLDKNLKLITSKKIADASSSFGLLKLIKYNSNNDTGVLIKNKDRIILLDLEFNVLASTQFEDIIQNDVNAITLKLNGKESDPQLSLYTTKASSLYSLKKNEIYTYVLLVAIISSIVIFLFLLTTHYIVQYFLIYLKYFNHSLYKSSDGILLLNKNGQINFYNKKLPTGFSADYKSGMFYEDFFIKVLQISKSISKSFNNGDAVVQEIILNTSDISFKGELKITPFKFFNKPFVYLIEIKDYTEKISSDRLKTWSSTIQRIAHEIKTPLSGINLGLDTLQNRLSKETNIYSKDITSIQNEVDRIKNLTKNFLLFSNLENPNFVKIRLSNLLNDSLSVFQSYLSSGIELTITSSDYTILGDVGQLKQLFHIIIENAIDACGGKGEIDIRSKNQVKRRKLKTEKQQMKDNSASFRFAGTGKKTNFIQIIISDNGKGISRKDLSKIFEPYFTTKKDGTGIGLAIAKKIVEDHKGKIEIESNLGVGTEVHIYLPVIE